MKLVWFRRDLRAVDNQALHCAVASGEPVLALFIATPKQWASHDMAPIQADFIYRRLTELQKELSALNIPLCYRQVDDFSASIEAVVEFAQGVGATHVLGNKDYEINEVLRDQHVATALAKIGIESTWFDDKCVQKPGSVLSKQGTYFKVFTPFKRAWMQSMSRPMIEKILPVQGSEAQQKSTWQRFVWSTEQPFDYPRKSSEQWPVHFDAIRQALRDFCRDKAFRYSQERDFPALDSTSKLSPYLAIGALSARQCMARLFAESEVGFLSEGAETWLSELVWREFYQHLLHFEPKLSKAKDFHHWGANLVWHNSDTAFQAWCEGQTGFPIVDAAMRQLNATGWMHNRLRMVVASFLTKDLHLDWRAGERYFMQHLIDGDYAANNGGWQWCASTGCDGQPYFRIFNPVSQSERFDPNGEFIRQWIPELASLDNKSIHQPWKAPNHQALSYPQPIVDHKAEREVTLSLYKQAKEN